MNDMTTMSGGVFGEARVGARVDLLGIGGRVESSVRLPIVTVRLSDSLDHFLARLRAEIEPLWNRARHSAAMDELHPDCTDKKDNCPCYFWKGQKPPLCAPCAEHGRILEAVRAGAVGPS